MKLPPAWHTECHRTYEKTLTSSPAALAAWDGITPLARNEWICWIEVCQESADPEPPDKKDVHAALRGEAPALLLGRLYSSVEVSA